MRDATPGWPSQHIVGQSDEPPVRHPWVWSARSADEGGPRADNDEQLEQGPRPGPRQQLPKLSRTGDRGPHATMITMVKESATGQSDQPEFFAESGDDEDRVTRTEPCTAGRCRGRCEEPPVAKCDQRLNGSVAGTCPASANGSTQGLYANPDVIENEKAATLPSAKHGQGRCHPLTLGGKVNDTRKRLHRAASDVPRSFSKTITPTDCHPDHAAAGALGSARPRQGPMPRTCLAGAGEPTRLATSTPKRKIEQEEFSEN